MKYDSQAAVREHASAVLRSRDASDMDRRLAKIALEAREDLSKLSNPEVTILNDLLEAVQGKRDMAKSAPRRRLDAATELVEQRQRELDAAT